LNFERTFQDQIILKERRHGANEGTDRRADKPRESASSNPMLISEACMRDDQFLRQGLRMTVLVRLFWLLRDGFVSERQLFLGK
jgi:hypothetical protein